jgi:glutamine synthetase
VNLLSPGKTPRTNLQFLTFFINTIAAVNRHEELLRASVASHGNEHRLGANEAPPAIVSVFSGSYLKDVIDMIETRVDEDKFDEQDNITLRLDIHNRIPDIMLDNTDRNRTSPFAFTGNKFEFRAVGSSANCALPMTVLNTIVAEQLKIFKTEVDEHIKGGDYKDVAILKVLRKTIKEAKRVMFEGDNYSDEWAKEAKKRGLSNNKTAPVALGAFVSDKSVKLFETQGIYTHREIEARYEIALENYIKAIQIESRALGEIVINQVIPACIEYQNKLITNVKGLKDVGIDAKLYSAQTDILKQICEGIDKLIKLEKEMHDLRVKGNDLTNVLKQALLYCDKVRPIMDEMRDITDSLESIVDDELWPLPKYREMLFSK